MNPFIGLFVAVKLLSKSNVSGVMAGDPFLLDRELQHRFHCREFILELALINFAFELSKSLVDFVIGLEF